MTAKPLITPGLRVVVRHYVLIGLLDALLCLALAQFPGLRWYLMDRNSETAWDIFSMSLGFMGLFWVLGAWTMTRYSRSAMIALLFWGWFFTVTAALIFGPVVTLGMMVWASTLTIFFARYPALSRPQESA